MDKGFWLDLGKNDFNIPDGYKVDELTKTLFGYLGNLDPELRDDIAYSVYANWLKRDVYSPDEIRVHIDELLRNLETGIGETESDSVFLRSFSVLLLAEIVHNDNKKSLLEKADIRPILAKGLWYLDAEKDPRGHIPVKGWAHALAHTADLMMVLGKNRHVEKDDLQKILQDIANKLVHSTNWVYIHGEDDRLATAVMMILNRNLLGNEFLGGWLKSITEPEKSWRGVFTEEGQVKAFHNSQNFLRSLLISILTSPDLPGTDDLEILVSEAVMTLAPY